MPFSLTAPPLKTLPTSQIWTMEVPEGLDWQTVAAVPLPAAVPASVEG